MRAEQGVLAKIWHYCRVPALIVGSILGLVEYGELFREHMRLFLAAWLVLPALGIQLRRDSVRALLTPKGLEKARIALTCLVAAISFAFLAHYDRVRDAVGTRLVGGYSVAHSLDVDGDVGPYRTSEVSTDHWYSDVALWLFEWMFLLMCVALPWLTWRLARGATSSASTRDTPLEA